MQNSFCLPYKAIIAIIALAIVIAIAAALLLPTGAVALALGRRVFLLAGLAGRGEPDLI